MSVSGRNLVVCLDGTTNEPETSFTNVARLFDMSVKDERQLVYYDPGVGTMGARAAITPTARRLTRFAGMVAGYGVHENIEEAYEWLATRYCAGDRIFIFGFSRGAYTARALAGMLRTVGLLHSDATNLIPYALKLYAKSGTATGSSGSGPTNATDAERGFWQLRSNFRRTFGNPAFPDPFSTNRKQVHFLGIWDSVKSVVGLNFRARLEVARWPFTANIANVAHARHALALDERRRVFAEYRLASEVVTQSEGRIQEMWFAGVHGDIGGQAREDGRLPDIALHWIAGEARALGLGLDESRYRRLMGVRVGEELPADRALGHIGQNRRLWGWLGWRVRHVAPGDLIHPTVPYRIRASAGGANPYLPGNLPPALRV